MKCKMCESEMKLLVNKFFIVGSDETHITYNMYYCPECTNVYGEKITENFKTNLHKTETFSVGIAEMLDNQIVMQSISNLVKYTLEKA